MQLVTVGLIANVVFNSGKTGALLFVVSAVGCDGLCCRTAEATDGAAVNEAEHAEHTEAVVDIGAFASAELAPLELPEE